MGLLFSVFFADSPVEVDGFSTIFREFRGSLIPRYDYRLKATSTSGTILVRKSHCQVAVFFGTLPSIEAEIHCKLQSNSR